MKPLTELKETTHLSVAALSLVCFAVWLAPNAFGVVPAPDGGYPGANTAEGQNALFSLSTGTYNTAVGFLSLGANTIGSFNTAFGAGTLLANTSANNTATGAGALLSNSTGSFNTADGAFTLARNATGIHNTAIGGYALEGNTVGMSNTAIGFSALAGNSTGNNNTAAGIFALWNNTTGNENIALGPSALFNSRTGDNNIALGSAAGSAVNVAHNVICIGTTGADVSDSFYVGNVFETSIDPDNLPVYIDFTGRLGTPSSSRRFKRDIRPMAEASEAVLALNPVTFHYESDPKNTRCFGLVAEEVAAVDQALVIRDKEGKPYTVRYDQVNAMLLNEFLKEHRKVEEMQKQIDALTAGLQKVSAQLEASKPALRVVNNNQ